MPTSQAATYASAPMLIGSTVPMTKSATSAMMETHSGPMAVLPRSSAESQRARPLRDTDHPHWFSGLANRSMSHLSIGCAPWIRPHASPGSLFPGKLVRTRLYEQVAEQITSWIAENGLQPGDRLPRRARAGYPPRASAARP